MVFSISFPSGNCFCDLCKRRLLGLRVKFPHSPILHYAFSSWIEKTMKKKQYIAIGKTDLFYNRMGLRGNFTKFVTVNHRVCFLKRGFKKEVLKMWQSLMPLSVINLNKFSVSLVYNSWTTTCKALNSS